MSIFQLKKAILLSSIFCICLVLKTDITHAQIEVTSGLTPPFTPENLISNVFLGDGVEVIDINFQGNGNAVGYFTDGLNDTGIDRGIVMSSGFATTADDANNAGGTSGSTSGTSVSDPDLSTIANAGIEDVVIYEITFIPTADTLRFRYAFASEEYAEYTCTDFNDAFGFFIHGPGINGTFTNNAENIALIPDPNDPTGLTFTTLPVTINNVHNGNPNDPDCTPIFPQYYNDNSGSTTLTYDAILDVFTAQAVVIPCQTYTIKLAICDRADDAFDSAVFLEAKSFGTGSLQVEATTLSLDGTITEDCVNGSFSISLPRPVESDYILDYTIFGTAENGIDYDFIPEDLFIPAGDSSITIPVIAFEDGLSENIEVIRIDIQRDPCNRDTFDIFIRDNTIIPPALGDDQILCQGNSYALDGTLPIPLPDPPNFTNETDFDIITLSNNQPPTPGTLPTISEIQVFGVQPPVLQDGVIKSVCINVEHPWISDIDAFLVSPGGQFIELTTDNGGSGNDYINTCFTPVSTDTIDFGGQAPATEAPFTGEWAPEGVWKDLWDGDYPTNGAWQLQILDDQTGFNGTLLDWSICFNPIYQVAYEWTPAAGLSCADCPNPIATPDTTTMYTLVATDTYGCSVTDSVLIEVIDNLDVPNASCEEVTTNSIEISWDAIIGATGYEISIDNGPWITPNMALGHILTGLGINQSYTFQIRGFDTQCIGPDTTITCTTLDCTQATPFLDAFTDASCLGIDNGTAQLSASGAEPPYTFALGNETNGSGTFTNIPAGNYVASVTDNLGCISTIDVVIGIQDTVEVTGIVVQDISCFEETDGVATVQIDGGTGPYQFTWSDNSTDSLLQNVGQGTYTVDVVDLNGCQGNGEIDLAQPDELLIDLILRNISCNAANDGSATASAIGGTAPYSYAWSINGSIQTTPTINDLLVGTYILEVTDDNGCTKDTVFTVSQNPALALNLTPFSVNCFGESNGAIQTSISGGSGTYTFDWSDLPGTDDPQNRQNLGATTYTVLVTDSENCTISKSITIDQPDEITATAMTTPANCANTNDATATLSVSGGSAPYQYDWSDNPMASDPDRTDLAAQDVTVTITDNNGCFIQVTLNPGGPDPIGLTTESIPTSCSYDSSGIATVIPAGGILPYSFQWDANTNNQTTASAIDLPQGIYNVTITDANGCTENTSVEILAPAAIEVQPTSQQIDCFGAQSGGIDLDISGGFDPYQIDWTGPNSYIGTGNSIANLDTGSYVYTVTDANGCIAVGNVDIVQPLSELSFSISEPDSICFDQTDGSASISTISGGTPPYSTLWSTGSTNATLTGLSPNIYSVTVTDALGCSLADTTFIVERPELELTLTQEAARCNGESNGSAFVSSILYGGLNANLNDYQYTWSTVPTQNSVQAIGLTGGELYEVIIEDEFGCQASESITIGNPDILRIDILEVQDVGCFGNNDGQIISQGLGGTPPYQYLWSANANGQSDATISDLLPGSYGVTIIDANGCQATNQATVDQFSAIQLDFIVTPPPCWGERAGIIGTNIAGGSSPYSFEWSNGSTEEQIDGLKAGEYFLTLTDNSGCSKVDSVNVPDPPRIELTFETTDLSCFESADGRILIRATGGTPGFEYSIDGENYSGGNLFPLLDAGEYRVYARDDNGCVSSQKRLISQPDQLIIDAGPDVDLALGDSLILSADVFGGTGNIDIMWDAPFDGTLFCEDGTTDCPEPKVKTLQTARYTVVGIDENGCVAEDDILIRVPKNRLVAVPTGFSPNGDGNNDRLIVHGPEDVQVNIFRIYDRWGELVFEGTNFPTNDRTSGWDGTFRGQEAQSGVYTWYLEAEYIDGFIEVLKGGTTLLR